MLDQFLMVVHFLGLALGLSTGFANMVMAGLIAKATPAERTVLQRFPPAMARVGAIGLAMLWASPNRHPALTSVTLPGGPGNQIDITLDFMESTYRLTVERVPRSDAERYACS